MQMKLSLRLAKEFFLKIEVRDDIYYHIRF
jgi:hypothetical protein